jgi:putative oxygen-independent coproporphyrinogen III oxidase
MPYSLYFHIPFCIQRCAYCDFNTYAGQEALIPDYVEALCREIEFVGAHLPSPYGGEGKVHTIFFGGGTPSLLTPKQFEQILQTVRDHFELSDLEASLEANPGTVSRESLRDLRRLGFNRISFGVQSFSPEELRLLERIHDPFDVFEAVSWARRGGFENLNLDLIYGLPEQNLERWSATVKQAVGLAPEHLSLYALTLEQGTPFGRWAARGLMPTPDPDLAAEMYEWSAEYLEAHGYIQYEISNWAKDDGGRTTNHSPSFACRHNLQTWRNQYYLGFGAGAHGYAAGVRYSNILRIKTYIAHLHPDPLIPDHHFLAYPFPLSPAVVNHHAVSLREEMQETMMLGLRLTGEGVFAKGFSDRFQVPMMDVFGKEIKELIGLGLLEWVDMNPRPSSLKGKGVQGDRSLRLTKRGRLLGNQVFMRFVGD